MNGNLNNALLLAGQLVVDECDNHIVDELNKSLRGAVDNDEAIKEELRQTKSLLSALWENRKDEDWCFEMEFTIDQVTQE